MRLGLWHLELSPPYARVDRNRYDSQYNAPFSERGIQLTLWDLFRVNFGKTDSPVGCGRRHRKYLGLLD